FEITPDIDMNLMQPNQSLTGLTGRVMNMIEEVLEQIQPNLLLVQGDTTTAFAAALAAFYRKIPVAHIEAGLRTHNNYNPFPEEANRRLITTLAEIHLAPTQLARLELLREGVSESKVVVTGNTVIDSLRYTLRQQFSFENTPLERIPFKEKRVILITCHRRESWEENLTNICLAIRDLVACFDDVDVVYPVHLNPKVQDTVHKCLGGTERIHLTPPLDYITFVNLMRNCYFVMTDSGGATEEAPTHHKPVLVLRDVIDRPEACQLGLAKLTGTGRERIFSEACRLLSDPVLYRSMADGFNPYGDGRASDRIVEVISRWASGASPLLPPEREFNVDAEQSYRLKKEAEFISLSEEGAAIH
ncbi:MAG TPA: UDP-N-acetylglucosamine 2-epimerase (non-hydrolyzing), partial [Acidobacteriota bacterium]|nr:UDP-N-acetylglucosamine 2-epimerase (non-hydrolyzing) [Acidobacteriota bacterium]